MIRLFLCSAIAVSGAVGAIAIFAPRPSLPQIKTEQDVRLMIIDTISVKAQSKLVSSTGEFGNRIELSRQRSLWGIPLGSKTLAYYVAGKVDMGYDLSKLTPESVQIQDSAVVITLPPLEILGVRTDMDKSHSLSDQSVPPEMVQQALQAGEASFRAIACATDTPATARQQAREDISNWLGLTDAGITVQVEEQPGGVCEGSIPAAEDVSNTTASYPVLDQVLGKYYVSQEFKVGLHDGVDVAMPIGSPLFMIGDRPSTVECFTEAGSGWGIYATVYVAEYGKSFLLAHLSECYPGEAQPGEAIALSGNTGRSTGPHLHLEQFTGEKSGYAAAPEPPNLKYLKEFIGVNDSLQAGL